MSPRQAKRLDRPDLRAGTMIREWCQACNYGQHEDCFNIRYGGQFMSGQAKGPCACKAARHVEPEWIAGTCRVQVHPSDGWSDSHPCGRTAKGEVPLWRGWMKPTAKAPGPDRYAQVPACGLHLAVTARRQAADEAREARYEAQTQADQRARENEQAARDYVALLASHNVASAIAYSRRGDCAGAVAIQGETAVQLVEKIILLQRELGLEGLGVLEMPT
jgi:hypothetical protein